MACGSRKGAGKEKGSMVMMTVTHSKKEKLVPLDVINYLIYWV